MALSHRVFTDALCDMQRAMTVLDQSFFDSFFDHKYDNENHSRKRRKTSKQEFGHYPATDMVERSESYELHAEVPGYDKKDIKIEIPDDHTVILSGSVNKERHEGGRTEKQLENAEKDNQTAEKQQENAEKDNQDSKNQQVIQKDQNNQVTHNSNPKWWVNERITGSFKRTFNFPDSIDADQVKASYQDGVLKIVVPKVNKSQSRFVNID